MMTSADLKRKALWAQRKKEETSEKERAYRERINALTMHNDPITGKLVRTFPRIALDTGILMTIPDGSADIQFIRLETGNTVTADDAAREGFCVPPRHTEAVMEGLLHLAKINGAIA